jgi:hypothetical protein
MDMPGRPRKWTEDDLRAAVPGARSWAEVARALGLKPSGRASVAMKALAEQLDLDTSAMRGQSWSGGTGNGRDKTKQRAAARRWYQQNPQVYLDRNVKKRRDRAALVREMKEKPCTDCGQTYPWYVMDFDHREGVDEQFDIAVAVRRGVAVPRLLAEIEKCDLVCANCHRIRTARRAGWDDGALLSMAQDT